MAYDNLEKVNCPACGKDMAKIFLNAHNFNIDICLDGCGGMFFDNREFNKVDERHEDIGEILKAVEGKSFAPVDKNAARICPACKSTMHKHGTSFTQAIQIETCYTCGAKFLDAGELAAIRDEYENNSQRAADVMNNFRKTFGSELAKIERDAEKARKVDTFFEALKSLYKDF